MPTTADSRRPFFTSAIRSMFVVALGFAGLGLTACTSMATPEGCERACTNVQEIFLGVVDEETSRENVLAEMGDTGAELARETASHFLKFLKSDCERQCNARATEKTVNCLSQAKSVQDLNRCYE